MSKLIIFYNTLCPVCKAGITRQERKMLALVERGELEFRDINDEPERLAEFGASLEDIRKKLHGLDGESLLIGADVALEIWRRTPGERWIAATLGNPIIRPLTHLGYNVLAHFLYGWSRRKGYCRGRTQEARRELATDREASKRRVPGFARPGEHKAQCPTDGISGARFVVWVSLGAVPSFKIESSLPSSRSLP